MMEREADYDERCYLFYCMTGCEEIERYPAECRSAYAHGAIVAARRFNAGQPKWQPSVAPAPGGDGVGGVG